MNAVNILLKRGIVTKEQIEEAREEARRTGIDVEKALVRLGYVTEEDIGRCLADEMGVPYMSLEGYLIDTEVIKLIPENLARKFKVIPLFKIGNTITLAMADPLNVMVIDEIRRHTGVIKIEPVFALPSEIERIIEEYYSTAQDLAVVVKEADEVIRKGKKEDVEQMVKEPPVVKLVNMLIMDAVKHGASDIHIEPEAEFVRVRFRIDGILHEIVLIPKHLQGAMISRVKILSNLDIAEKRRPQDGRFIMKIQNREIDIRVSIFPTVYGENVVMRLLDKSSAIMRLPELGMDGESLRVYSEIIRKPYGIILVTGPTGSGKTTTLYASLSVINSIGKNIITLEDPVEYDLPLVRQTQVNPKVGLTFATGLRSILRQDPDIIMVGEIRDVETAEIAIQAALTGHLVFSTLHTNDAPSVITRLLEMNLEPFLIANAILCVMAQRLVRRLCERCKEEYVPSKSELERLGIPSSEGITLWRPKGCDECRNTGYRGRIGIFELLVFDEEVRRYICEKASADVIRKYAESKGMESLREDGIKKMLSGQTSVEEVFRITMEV